jgi:hypothetical protein
MKTVQIAQAYTINDDFVVKTREFLPRLLFTRGRCLDLLCLSAFTNPPYPEGIGEAEKEEYRARFQEIALRFQEQALQTYREILQFAQQGHADGEYVNHAYVRLYQNYPEEFGLKKEKRADASISSGPEWKAVPDSQQGWNELEYNDSKWYKVRKMPLPETVKVTGFPGEVPVPMWLYKGETEDEGSVTRPSCLYFRRTFYVTETPHEAELFATAVSDFSAFLNGSPLQDTADSTSDWHRARKWNLVGKLRHGKNVLAARVWAASDAGPCGLMPYLSLTVTAYDYLPVFPGTDVPLDPSIVKEGNWVFPYIKNFSPDAGMQTNMSN